MTRLPVELEGQKLRGASHDGQDLQSARLQRTSVDASSFARARMASAFLSEASVVASRFDGADLERSDWTGATVAGTSFVGARMADAVLTRATFEACDFRGADLRTVERRLSTVGATFRRCDFRGANLDQRYLAGTTFEGCAFSGVLGRPDLGDARIVAADLSVAFDGSVVLVDPVTSWSTLQSSDMAIAGAVTGGAVQPAPAPIGWMPLAGATYMLGLTDEEARRYAAEIAAQARRQAADDPDQLHPDREQRELAQKWGNPDYLYALLACSRPAHAVQLDAFAISAGPVTVAEYGQFVRETRAAAPASWSPSSKPKPGEPVTGVSWEEAAAYAKWRGAALPTEAQWEYAARGPDRSWLPWGEVRGVGEGLYEWCADEFGPYPGAPADACDQIPPPPGGWAGNRVRRAGPLMGFPPSAVTRRGAGAALRLRDTTFRLVKTS